MSEKEFVKNCTKTGCYIENMGVNKNTSGYFFSDDPDKQSSNVLVAEFTDSTLTKLTAVNMIGD
jgi:hypothetical protein